MNKIRIALLLLMTVSFGFSQKQSWKGYFSYRYIKDISEGQTKITAAAENALFTKNLTDGSIKSITTIDGLSGLTISAIYHSDTFKKTLIGYENGLMIVVNEVDGSVLNVVDILNKALPPNIKKINHITEFEGIAYISCDFGIVQYNLTNLVFGDTYFIGNNGAQIVIRQTAVFNGKIYAATLGFGIRVADIANANLNDFNQWTTLDANGWNGVEAFGTELLAVTNTGGLQRFQGTNFTPFQTLSAAAVDMRHSGQNLILTTPTNVYIYDASLLLVRNISATELGVANLRFSCATAINGKVYLGTEKNGLFTTAITPAPYEDMTPDGPIRNNIFAISATANNLWSVYGGYDQNYNPFAYEGGLPPSLSVSKYRDGNWLEIPYGDLLGAQALVRITPNPNNENEVYISSFHRGILKIENDVPTVLYNNSNSTLDAIAGDNIRVDGTAFDSAGNFWATESLSENGLKVLRSNGQWAEYSLAGLFSEIGGFNMGRLTIDRNGTKWMPTRQDGLIAFNEGANPVGKTLKNTPESGNLPNIDVRVTAVDNRNQLWIGCTRGLRVLSSVDSFLNTEQPIAEPIIIVEDGLAQELLYEQNIRDIVVDGSNNKWIGTQDSGAFLVSPNGQETLYHFTTDNSPLPSNAINDIAINGVTGEVFFATNKGMISFNGISTDPSANLNNVYIWPNPVRPGYNGTVKVSGLIDNANVKIADIEGNLVYETVSEGGTIEWDTTAFGKYKVASGVYMVFIAAEDGSETKVKKVMIVR